MEVLTSFNRNIFDTLNAKAAIYAIKKYFRDNKSERAADHDQRNYYRCKRTNIKRANTGSILYFCFACKAIKHWIKLCTRVQHKCVRILKN